jgi:predicted dehydrogenase/dienelactone hydrolase
LKTFESREFADADGNVLPYRLLKPVDHIFGKKYPLLVFLHGAGERGNDNASQLKHAAKEFADEERRRLYPSYVLIPQCPSDCRWVETDWKLDAHDFPMEPSKPMKLVKELVDTMIENPGIDENRIYVTGISMGGFGTWDALARYEGIFAAAVPICGGGDLKIVSKLVDLPIWAFHGAKDPVVKVARSRDMIQALKAAGNDARYTEYPDAVHDCWTETYKDPELYAWLFAQSKESTIFAPSPLAHSYGRGAGVRGLGVDHEPRVMTKQLSCLNWNQMNSTSSMARRDFNKTLTAGLLVGTSTGALPSASFANGSRKLGVAVVGLGTHSLSHAIPSLVGSQSFELRAIVSQSQAKAESVAEKLNGAPVATYDYDAFERLAGDKRVDLVYIAVPTASHETFAVKSAKAGKHIVIAAPLSHSYASAKRIRECCRANGTQLAVMSPVDVEREVEHSISKVVDSYRTEVVSVGLQFGQSTVDGKHWRINQALGGGALLTHGPMLLNAARRLLGAEPISITAAEVKTDFNKFEAGDESMCWAMHYQDRPTVFCTASLHTIGMNTIDIRIGDERAQFKDAFLAPGATAQDGNPFDVRELMAQGWNQLAVEFSTNALSERIDEELKNLRLLENIARSARESRTLEIG